MKLNSRQNKVCGEKGHKKRINQNATINVECLLCTQRSGYQVRVIPLQGPIKRFVKSLCLDVKWAFKRIELAP